VTNCLPLVRKTRIPSDFLADSNFRFRDFQGSCHCARIGLLVVRPVFDIYLAAAVLRTIIPVWHQIPERSSYQPLEAYRKFSTRSKSVLLLKVVLYSMVFPSGETVKP
jgi:hypothetical protein